MNSQAASLGSETTPPAPDQVEVTFFGPGIGEAILIHVGSGRWIAIDSCVRPGHREAAPLEYLRLLGQPATSIDLIVASHWHDDHVSGLSQILAEAPNSPFVVAGALTKPEFSALSLFYRGRPVDKVSGGTREMYTILSKLKGETRRKISASHNKLLLEIPKGLLAHGLRVEVRALSPSDEEVENFIARIAGQKPKPRTGRALPAPDPNDVSIALKVSIGDLHLLFGADLENGPDERRGWSAVVSKGPLSKSVIFKVSHHGSENAHHPAVWEHMLEDSPIAVIAPYARGRKKLPAPLDIQRIKGLTAAAFVTAPVTGTTSKTKRPRAVTKTLKEMGSKIRRVPFGAIRLRSGPKLGVWGIELFEEATQAEYAHET